MIRNLISGLVTGLVESLLGESTPAAEKFLSWFYPLTADPLEKMDTGNEAVQTRTTEQSEVLDSASGDLLFPDGTWDFSAIWNYATQYLPGGLKYFTFATDEPALSDQGLAVRDADTNRQWWSHDVTQSDPGSGSNPEGWWDFTRLTTSYASEDTRSNYGMSSIRETAVNNTHSFKLGEGNYAAHNDIGVCGVIFPEGDTRYVRFSQVGSLGGVSTFARVTIDLVDGTFINAGTAYERGGIKQHKTNGWVFWFQTDNESPIGDPKHWLVEFMNPADALDNTFLGDIDSGIDLYGWNAVGDGEINNFGAIFSEDGSDTATSAPTDVHLPGVYSTSDSVTVYGETFINQDYAGITAGNAAQICSVNIEADGSGDGLALAWDKDTGSLVILLILSGVPSGTPVSVGAFALDYEDVICIMFEIFETYATVTVDVGGTETSVYVDLAAYDLRSAAENALFYTSALLAGEEKVYNTYRNWKSFAETGYSLSEVGDFDEDTPPGQLPTGTVFAYKYKSEQTALDQATLIMEAVNQRDSEKIVDGEVFPDGTNAIVSGGNDVEYGSSQLLTNSSWETLSPNNISNWAENEFNGGVLTVSESADGLSNQVHCEAPSDNDRAFVVLSTTTFPANKTTTYSILCTSVSGSQLSHQAVNVAATAGLTVTLPACPANPTGGTGNDLKVGELLVNIENTTGADIVAAVRAGLGSFTATTNAGHVTLEKPQVEIGLIRTSWISNASSEVNTTRDADKVIIGTSSAQVDSPLNSTIDCQLSDRDDGTWDGGLTITSDRISWLTAGTGTNSGKYNNRLLGLQVGARLTALDGSAIIELDGLPAGNQKIYSFTRIKGDDAAIQAAFGYPAIFKIDFTNCALIDVATVKSERGIIGDVGPWVDHPTTNCTISDRFVYRGENGANPRIWESIIDADNLCRLYLDTSINRIYFQSRIAAATQNATLDIPVPVNGDQMDISVTIDSVTGAFVTVNGVSGSANAALTDIIYSTFFRVGSRADVDSQGMSMLHAQHLVKDNS